MEHAHIHPSLAPIGTIQDGTEAQIAVAEDWLRSQGCTHARGPMGASTWQSYRASLGPHDRPPFLGEPTASATLWELRGYRPVAHYASALADNMQQIESSMARACSLVTAGWTLQTLDEAGGFQAALPTFYALSTAAFTEAFAYTPIDLAAFEQLYRPLEPLIDPGLVLLALSPEGEPAGYCLAIPDRLNPQLQQFIVKTIAVDPRWRGQGIGSWMVGNAHSRAHTAGWTAGGIHALMWTGSHSRKISAHAGHIIRRYALYEKAL
jgi:GNAT superfamily N-acetyltransferase